MALMKAVSRYEKKLQHVLDIRFDLLVVPENIPLRRHTVVQNEKLTDIAWKWFGDAQYYWVIADVNGIFNPHALPVPGTELLVPDPQIIEVIRNAAS